jgi:hypothetical protein
VKKRGRRWVWVSVGAAVVAIAACALAFREQPPYEFLRGAERISTTTTQDPSGAYSVTTYVTDAGVDDVVAAARAELSPREWEYDGERVFMASRALQQKEGRYTIWAGVIEDHEDLASSMYGPYRGMTYVSCSNRASVLDRFNAWLDRVTGRL